LIKVVRFKLVLLDSIPISDGKWTKINFVAFMRKFKIKEFFLKSIESIYTCFAGAKILGGSFTSIHHKCNTFFSFAKQTFPHPLENRFLVYTWILITIMCPLNSSVQVNGNKNVWYMGYSNAQRTAFLSNLAIRNPFPFIICRQTQKGIL